MQTKSSRIKTRNIDDGGNYSYLTYILDRQHRLRCELQTYNLMRYHVKTFHCTLLNPDLAAMGIKPGYQITQYNLICGACIEYSIDSIPILLLMTVT